MIGTGRALSRPVIALGMVVYGAALAVGFIWMHIPPEAIFLLTVGAILLVVMAMRPLVALHVFIMLMTVEAIPVTRQEVTAMKLVGVFVVAGWALSMANRRRMPARIGGLLVALLLFVLWGAICVIDAIDSTPAISRMLTFGQLAMATVMFSTAVDEPAKLRGIYWAVVFWTLVSALVGIGSYYMGWTPVAEGLAGNRNALAAFINAATVCACFLLQTTQRPLLRLLLAASLPVFFLGVALTLSRTGLIALALTLVLVWYKITRQRGFFVVGVSLAMVAATALFLPEIFWKRAETIVPSIQRQEDTFGMRLKFWRMGLRIIEDRPLTGVGPGNFMAALPRYGRGEMLGGPAIVAHNTYIGVAAEMGLIGLALFLVLPGMALYGTHKVATAAGRGSIPREHGPLALAAEIVIIVLLVEGLTGNVENYKFLWLFLGLAIAIRRMAPDDAKVSRTVTTAEATVPLV